MVETRKLQKMGGSKALTLPAGWLQMIERAYGHEITEVSIEDNGASLTLKPLFNHGFDVLKYESGEDAYHGPHQIARPTPNEINPQWKVLLDKIARSGGRFIEDGLEYWRIDAPRDLHNGHVESILHGIARKRLPK